MPQNGQLENQVELLQGTLHLLQHSLEKAICQRSLREGSVASIKPQVPKARAMQTQPLHLAVGRSHEP